MKKKTYLLIVVGLASIFAIMIFLVNQKTISAQECRIVRILSTGHPAAIIKIEPRTTRISKGDCLVWLNWARTENVTVGFEEGKKCDDVTDAPVGFKLDASNCYVTSYIPLGGTSSLRFNEEGTFEYIVEASGATKAKGEIIVY